MKYMMMLAKNIILKAILKKNIMIINYNFNEMCSDDSKFLYLGLVEIMEKYNTKFKLKFNNSNKIGIEIVKQNNNIEEARLRLFRIKANKDLREYAKKCYY